MRIRRKRQYSWDKVIAAAEGQIGYHEGRSKSGHWNNNQKFSKTVPGLAWSNWQPWCDTFVAWCFYVTGFLKLLAGGPTASVPQSIANWKSAKRWSEYPAIGAQVCYGNGAHTGIVKDYNDRYIWAIEGNTNDNGSAEGDGVYLKQRERRDAWVTGYGYPDYPEGIISADPAWAHAAPKPIKKRKKRRPNAQAVWTAADAGFKANKPGSPARRAFRKVRSIIRPYR